MVFKNKIENRIVWEPIGIPDHNIDKTKCKFTPSCNKKKRKKDFDMIL